MRFGTWMLGITTILFGVYGTALKDAHPQSAADSRAAPLILEKGRRTSRSKTQGDSRTDRAVHD